MSDPLEQVAEAVTAPSQPASAVPSSAAAAAASPNFLSGLSRNPMFAGGLGIAGLGVGAAMLRRGLLSGMQLAQKHLTVSLEIASKDRSYQWMLHWINRHTRGRTQHLGVETSLTQAPAGGQVQAKFDFVPSTGSHWFWYKKR